MSWLSRLSTWLVACMFLAGGASGQESGAVPRQPLAPAGSPSADDLRATRDRLFDQLDLDGDGKVTLDEIPEPLRERARPLFERLGKTTIVREDLERLGEPQQPSRPRSIRGPAIFRVLDEDGDGRITREELARAGEKFDELDTDGNGVLTPDELFGLPGGFVRPELPDTRPRETVRPADTPRPQPAASTGNARGAAETGDAADIGNVAGPGPESGSLADRLFHRYDRDGDGRLSPQEVPALLREHFDRFDADGDGFIDRDEFERVVAQVRPE